MSFSITYKYRLLFLLGIFGFLGETISQPIINVVPDTLLANINGCCDSTSQSFTIYNTGSTDLIYKNYCYFYEDFENSLDNWVGTGTWSLTSDSYEGANALAENPFGDYSDYMYQYIELKNAIVVNDAASCTLTYMRQIDIEDTYDFFNTQISINNGPYITLSSVDGYDPWSLQTFNLAGYLSDGDSLKVRFEFESDGSVTYPGVEIDSLVITSVAFAWFSMDNLNDTVAPGGSSVVILKTG